MQICWGVQFVELHCTYLLTYLPTISLLIENTTTSRPVGSSNNSHYIPTKVPLTARTHLLPSQKRHRVAFVASCAFSCDMKEEDTSDRGKNSPIKQSRGNTICISKYRVCVTSIVYCYLFKSPSRVWLGQ